VFEHFSTRGRSIVVLAQEESRLLAHNRIGTEHLLLGLLHVENHETALALQRAGVTLLSARQYVEKSQGGGKKEPSGHIPFTPRAKKVLELSLRVSQRLDGHSIGEPHLLRAILDVPDSTAFQVLEFFAVDIEALAHTADELALASPADDGEFVTRTGRAEASSPISSQRTSRRLSRRTDYLFGLQSHDRLVARIEELAIQREALDNALRRFGRHDEGCQPERGCSCGLQLVLDSFGPASG